MKNPNSDEDVIQVDEYNDTLLEDSMHEWKYDLEHTKEYKL